MPRSGLFDLTLKFDTHERPVARDGYLSRDSGHAPEQSYVERTWVCNVGAALNRVMKCREGMSILGEVIVSTSMRPAG
jgi:hypothetical protein